MYLWLYVYMCVYIYIYIYKYICVCNLGKALKKTGKAVAKGAKAAAPYVSAASDAAILAGALTGQPEVVALGTAGKAASKLAGGAKKKKPMKKPARYRLSQDPTQI